MNRNEPPGAASTGEVADVLEALNDLLQLDHDSVAAYEVAREHLQNPEYSLQIRAFQTDHERHIQELNDLIVELGGHPANEPHATVLLKEGIQRLAAAGGDRRLLAAWRTNELRARARYRALNDRSIFWPERVRGLIARHGADEERHYQWAVGVLGDEVAELSDRDGLRERLSGWTRRHAVPAGTRPGLREQAASALSGAAARLDQVGELAGSGFRARAAGGARRAARGLDAAARGLQDPTQLDPRPVLEREIRERPARALGAIFAAGFLIGRILR